MEEVANSKVLGMFKKYKEKNSFMTKDAAMTWLTSQDSDPAKLFNNATREFCEKFTELKRRLMEFIDMIDLPSNIGSDETIEFIYAPAGIALVHCRYDLSSMDMSEENIAIAMSGTIMPCDYEVIEFIARAEFPYDITPRVFEKRFGCNEEEQNRLNFVFWAAEMEPDSDPQISAYNRAVMYMPISEILESE